MSLFSKGNCISPVFIPWILVLLTLGVYFFVFNAGFIWDDDDYILNNKAVKTLKGLFEIWSTVLPGKPWYPMVHSSFWLEFHLWGMNACGYHAVNILLHALNAVLLWRILLFLEFKGAFVSALLFAVHPVHLESVAWITERKNVLSGLFYLLSAGCFFRFFLKSLSWQVYSVSLLFFILALLSKTVTCTLPVILFLVIWYKTNRVSKKLIFPLIPFLGVGIFLGLLTAFLEVNVVGASGEDFSWNFLQRSYIATRAVLFYISKLLFPVNLSFIYEKWILPEDPFVLLILPVSLFLFFIICCKRGGKGIFVSFFFFCITLFPALGFFNVYPMKFSFVADHFQYLASIGLFTLAGELYCRLAENKRWMKYGGILILIGMMGQTLHESLKYKNVKILWEDTLKKNPRAYIAHNNLGNIYFYLGNYDLALFHYKIALTSGSFNGDVLNNLGLIFKQKKDFSAAIVFLKKAYIQSVNKDQISFNLGNIYMELGQLSKAFLYFKESVRWNSFFYPAHYNLGVLYLGQEDFEKAVFHFSEALKIKPEDPFAQCNLAVAYGATLRKDKARTHYELALKYDPKLIPALLNYGQLLLEEGERKKAGEYFKKVLELAPDNSLAKKYSEAGSS